MSGTAGTGKTSIAGSFVNGACNGGGRALYLAFEESPQQLVRNMRSIGMSLEQHIRDGLLTFHASRPTLNGLEMHLIAIHKLVQQIKPDVVVLDPITNLVMVKSMLIRLIDFLQSQQITVLFTALTSHTTGLMGQADEGVASLVDAWLLVRDIESNGERNRGLYIMKSRGMKHSNQVREFIVTDDGIDPVDVYLGPDGVLTGSARAEQALQEATGVALRNNALSRRDREIERKRSVLESKITSLKEEFESVQEELNKSYIEDELRKEILEKNREQLTRNRHKEEW